MTDEGLPALREEDELPDDEGTDPILEDDPNVAVTDVPAEEGDS